ncbi:MAG: diguanylate cyclase [Hydrogenovibrio sp.]
MFIDEDIKQALAQQNRPHLQALTERLLHKAKQNDPYLQAIHYHLPDGRSFLRLHRPGVFSDTIAAKRPYIEQMHQHQTKLYGFENGLVQTPLFRVIEPLFWQGEYIGAVEIGASPKKVLDLLAENNLVEGVMTFFKAQPPVVFETIRHPELLSRYQQHIRYDTTLPSTISADDKRFQYERFPIEDFSGQPIGEFVFFYDVTAFYDDFHTTLLVMAAASAGILLTIFLLLKLLVRRYERMLMRTFERTQKILDAQSDIVLVTNGSQIIEVNQRFLDVLQYDSLASFLQEHQCICECFLAGKGLVTTFTENQLWTHYLLEHPHKENLAKIRLQDRILTYSLHAQWLNDSEIVITMQDITDLKNNERALRDYLRLVDQNLLISSTDLDGNITYVSQALIKVSGYRKEELIGFTHRVIRHPDMPDELFDDLWDTILQDNTWHGELKSLTRDGDFFWSELWIHPKFDELGEKVGYTAIRHDITDKKRLEATAITDGLTGLYNRRHFDTVLPKLLNAAKRKNESLAFAILDVDYFKPYNDTYGHQKGDWALKEVARVLQHNLKRADDFAFRLGGEEFGVVFKVEAHQNALQLMELIRQGVENSQIEHAKNSASSYLTVSIGLVCRPAADISDIDALYKDSDKLLYQAKESGRNRVVVETGKSACIQPPEEVN